MNQELLEKHEALVLEMADLYLDNMEVELGRKYLDNKYEVNGSLSQMQYLDLKKKHRIPDMEFAEVVLEFQKMGPTEHLMNAMGAFTASGGNVDIEPSFDEHTQRLSVPVSFVIKENTLDRIEGLSQIEDMILRVDAMVQVDTLLSEADPDDLPTF